MTVRYSNHVGIRVRVLGYTVTKGLRLRVWRSDSTYNDDPNRLTVDWSHDLNGSDNAVAAVGAYIAAAGDGWDGGHWSHWVIAGAGTDEWIAVWSGQ